MQYKIIIYKDNKFYKEEDLKQKGENYIYKWGSVESGSYFFEIKNEENNAISGVTYSHTAPFAKRFEAVVDENLPPKSITGFQKGIDIYVEYSPVKKTFSLTKMKFYRMNLDISDFGLTEATNVEIAGNFNSWKTDPEPEIHSNLFRPPHGWMRPSQYAWLSRTYKVVMWDLVTRDYSKWMTAEDVLNNVKRYVRNGSIITFHDSLKSIDKLHFALPQALEWLKEQGYEFKTFE